MRKVAWGEVLPGGNPHGWAWPGFGESILPLVMDGSWRGRKVIAAVYVHKYTSGDTEHADPYTVVLACLSAEQPRIRVEPAKRLRFRRRRRGQVLSGDPAFDSRVSVFSAQPDQVHALLTPDARNALLTIPVDHWDLCGTYLAARWPGFPVALALQGQLDLLLDIADSLGLPALPDSQDTAG
ncbi:hypothetical protein [Actinomadura terrae]|uniref:hypothetical protein n=1 Tax=Actinomadura terrae TaxID=604353 RepID=UPI001FA6E283|nr:hypothetical protein [Actinomadura terrae]